MAPAIILILIFVLIIYVALAIKIIQQHQLGLTERFGRYRTTLDPGLHMIIPFIDKVRRIDMREQVVDVPPQEVITKDNVVVDRRRGRLLPGNRSGEVGLQRGELHPCRHEARPDEPEECHRRHGPRCSVDFPRETINTELRMILDEATDVWGTRVVRVEIQRIDPPTDVTEAMHRQMKAERTRRAVVTEAEGEKRSAILTAEGVKQAAILDAEGKAQAIKEVADAEKYQLLTVAEGEGQAVERVYAAIHTGDPTPDLIAIKYLEALQAIADGQATKIFLPMETSGILSSIGAIGEIFNEQKSE